jgi:hypothetical protein
VPALDPYGNPGDVNTGDAVDPTWGDAVTTTVVRRYPDTTARDQWQNPPRGAVAATVNDDTLWQATGSSTHWTRMGRGLIGPPTVLATPAGSIAQAWVTVGTLNFNAFFQAGHRYWCHAAMYMTQPGGGATYTRGRINASVSGILVPTIPVYIAAANGAVTLTIDAFLDGTGAQQGVSAQAMVDAGTVAAAAGSFFLIQDVGAPS